MVIRNTTYLLTYFLTYLLIDLCFRPLFLVLRVFFYSLCKPEQLVV